MLMDVEITYVVIAPKRIFLNTLEDKCIQTY
jgi:hypothetical protein